MICSFAFYASPFYLAYFLVRQGEKGPYQPLCAETILKSEKKGRALFLCWLRSHSLSSTIILQYPFQGPCSCHHLCNHHHLYVHSLQECPRSQECCQPSGPWPLSQFPFPWRMLQEVRMVGHMKPCVTLECCGNCTAVHQKYIVFVSIVILHFLQELFTKPLVLWSNKHCQLV